ncbi:MULTISPECIES: NOB1 family endonuclease [Acidiplasma]|uniref:NOB1 family endonuclease n=1 Tax=Acidiplasma TaxID=507753 RepID=UPI000AFE03A0|nr:MULTISPECIES: hypothetical protein [Acidiplasma]WMT54466.1 MAG: hypothetical protein RE470_05995 [Acidiplasma sp.]
MENNIYYVIDTSAILSGKINIAAGNLIFPESVINEIQHGNIKYLIDSMENIRVYRPEEGYLNIVKEASKKTGDYNVLSSTDMDIIALALQFNAIIITDDYAIQNVASRLKIKYSGASINEIKREIRWLYRCTGCHKIYNEDIKECPVCGHKLKRFTKKL